MHKFTESNNGLFNNSLSVNVIGKSSFELTIVALSIYIQELKVIDINTKCTYIQATS